jgi:hypothetical protein
VNVGMKSSSASEFGLVPSRTFSWAMSATLQADWYGIL